MSSEATTPWRVTGMHCAACATRLEKNLNGHPLGAGSRVNFALRKAWTPIALPADVAASLFEEAGFKGAPLQEDSLIVSRSEEKKALEKEARIWWASFAAALPVFILGMLHIHDTWSGLTQFLLTTFLMLGPARGFFVRAARLLRKGATSMDTLVASGALAAWSWSSWAMLHHEDLYFESAAVVLCLILLGKHLEERARHSATGAMEELLRLQPLQARVWCPDTEEWIELEATALQVGDRVKTLPGESFAADGRVVLGHGQADEKLLTGEFLPVEKSVGDGVVAGAVCVGAPLEFEVSAVGGETALQKIVRHVGEAQAEKPPIQRAADAVASRFVPGVLVLAALTAAYWIWQGAPWVEVFRTVSAVLLVACPCALGLATPMAILVGTGRAAQKGVLVRSPEAFEVLHKVRTIVVDKTGTLTTGNMGVLAYEWGAQVPPESRTQWAAWVGALERNSIHPVASALVTWSQSERGDAPEPSTLEAHHEVAGEGLVAQRNGQRFRLGRPRHMREEGRMGATQVALETEEGHEILWWKLGDSLRGDTPQAVSAFRAQGLQVVMATGDNPGGAQAVAEPLGIPWKASLTPGGKAELIKELRAQGAVAMVGDGINDAPALAAADVGLAIGGGTGAAREAAAITLGTGSLCQVLTALTMAKATFRNIRQNLFWAFIYNALLIPLAASGQLTPMWAGGAMALSSLFVVGNALRLRAA